MVHRIGLTVAAVGTAVVNPDRGEAVAAVGELTAGPTLKLMVKRMMSHKDGRWLLREQPRITDETLKIAEAMPPGSLGKVYADYMNANGFLPSGRAEVLHVSNPYEAYAMTRYRESHDFLHALTDCDRTVLGEVALKAWEFAQTGLPLGAFALIGGAPHLTWEQQKLLKDVYVPWALRSRPGGENDSVFFMNLRWEDLLGKDLEDIRREVRWEPLPRCKNDPRGQLPGTPVKRPRPF